MNSTDYPFHYEIRFKLLAFVNENKTTNQSFVKVFKKDTPLKNRKSAFEEFNEYVSFIEKVGRLQNDDNGNQWISQPSFVNEILSKILTQIFQFFLNR